MTRSAFLIVGVLALPATAWAFEAVMAVEPVGYSVVRVRSAGPEAVLAGAMRFLSRGGEFEVSTLKPLAHLERTTYRARLEGRMLALLDHPSKLRLEATTRETVPELWDEKTGLSFYIIHATRFAVAGCVTRWEGRRAIEQTDFRILPADLSGLDPLARLLLRGSDFDIRHGLHRLPIDSRFSLLERVPFWTRTPRRAHYQAKLLLDGDPVADLVIDNDARPGTILSVTPTGLTPPDFDRTVWSIFPYRCNLPGTCRTP